MLKVTGIVCNWSAGGEGRDYVVLTLPFAEAYAHFVPDQYDHEKNTGEQREIIERHVAKLMSEMEHGNFTPTSWSAGLREDHREKMAVVSDKHGQQTFSLEISPDNPVPLTDGQQRRCAMHLLSQKPVSKEDSTPILPPDCPVTILLMLSGNTRHDFINLQLGRHVDTSHLWSLRISTGLIPAKLLPFMNVAHEIAKLLNNTRGRRYNRMIAIDPQCKYPIRFTTLIARSTGDGSTSLVGMARVADHFGAKPKELATIIDRMTEYFSDHIPDIVAPGMILAQPPDQTMGSVCLLIGVATQILFARYRLKLTMEDLYIKAAKAAATTLHYRNDGSVNIVTRRRFMGEFARGFFHGWDLPLMDGVPIELMQILTPGAYGVNTDKKNLILPETAA